ncbi:MAG: T9SS type A sorting domain-containing protein [Saprospiraceae bacterium]|nr:T9SS type A sorting domain-containing protein [Saprospiraceae bacterium]
MKKLCLLFAFAFTLSFVDAQQRLCLLEEFTQASCGPCAAQNPALNTLLSANTAKVVSIKYQTDWPGADPMNAQNPGEVATRVSYYGVTGVPNIEFDGNVIGNGAPNQLSQSGINSRYAVASPYNIDLTHTLSADYDSIFISCTVTCVADNASGAANSLKLHIAMIEREILFTSAPGTNGETEFYNVMRKMYPNASGTQMADTWTAGQSQTVTFAAALPAYIYNKSEVGVVAFIQDNSNKNIKQAGYSEPIPLLNDAETTSVSGLPGLTCVETVTPVVVLKNVGSNNLTSATIETKINGVVAGNKVWTGDLQSGATANVTLDPATLVNGTNNFAIEVTNVNGIVDENLGLPTTISTLSPFNAIDVPVNQGFQSATFPPTNMMIANPDAGSTWSRSTAGITGNAGSAKMDFYNSPSGQIDDLYLPNVSIPATADYAYITFSRAHARYNTTFADQLSLQLSPDCGATWETVWQKEGNDLATTSPTTSAYTPSASHWVVDSVAINGFIGLTDVMVRFHALSDYGNNAYVDNVVISTNLTLSVIDNEIANTIKVFPNPTSGFLSIERGKYILQAVEVLDITGKVVKTFNNVQNNLNINDLTNGTYFLRFTTQDGVAAKRIIVQH